MVKAATVLKHYFISGRVQGVGFRAFTKNLAESMKLVGWVRNLADGRVEAMVGGPAEVIGAFEIKLHEGPMFGKVDRIETRDGLGTGEFSKFEVRRDG